MYPGEEMFFKNWFFTSCKFFPVCSVNDIFNLKIMIVESFPSNITYWGAVVFEKWVKQCHENTFVIDLNNFGLMSPKLFSCHCFTHSPKTRAPQHVMFSGKLSTIIIFKLCKFSVNLWTLCFLSYKKYIHPLRQPPISLTVTWTTHFTSLCRAVTRFMSSQV